MSWLAWSTKKGVPSSSNSFPGLRSFHSSLPKIRAKHPGQIPGRACGRACECVWVLLGIEPRTSNVPSKRSTELYLQLDFALSDASVQACGLRFKLKTICIRAHLMTKADPAGPCHWAPEQETRRGGATHPCHTWAFPESHRDPWIQMLLP